MFPCQNHHPVLPLLILAASLASAGCRIDNPQAGVWYAQVQDGTEPFDGVTVAPDVTIP